MDSLPRSALAPKRAPGSLVATAFPPLIVATLIAVYGAGLAGPFVLDDHVNLAPVWLWSSGQSEFSTLFSNPSGPLGRPLAMASFALNAWIGDDATFGFKLVNLLIHVANTVLVWLVSRRVLHVGAPPPPASRGAAIAALLAALWSLHPQHVSSVLYVVQRMALLGATAQFAAVLVYLEARSRLTHAPKQAAALLFLVFPALVMVGMLGKESAALAPLLCLALELTLFSRAARPPAIRAFFASFVVVPLIAGVVLLAASPMRLLGGYAGREFDLAQRVLSEPRIVLDYAVGWFAPLPSQLALYRDGYPLSDGWFDPPATIVAIAFVSALLLVAWRSRRRMPLLAAGIAWFFAAHLLESTVLPLEPYFEHRNYVASFGLLLAAAALAMRLPISLRATRAASAMLLLALALATGARSWHWGSLDRLLASEGPPTGEISRRLQIDRAIRAFERSDADAREAALDLLAGGDGGDASAAALWRAIFACDGEGRLAAPRLAAMRATPPPVLTHNHVSWLWVLTRRAQSARCDGLDRDAMLELLDHWERSAHRPPTSYALAQMARMRSALSAAAIR